jgi:ABC-type antimicrobial peptide transport system permease subunit
VGEAVTLSLAGGLLGVIGAYGLVYLFTHSPNAGGFFPIQITSGILLFAMMVAGIVGFLSAVVPSYHASEVNIVEGLRHIG